jgi:hypothetical protein
MYRSKDEQSVEINFKIFGEKECFSSHRRLIELRSLCIVDEIFEQKRNLCKSPNGKHNSTKDMIEENFAR